MKIICVGRNYVEHAAEIGDAPPTTPLLFGKFENTQIGPDDASGREADPRGRRPSAHPRLRLRQR
jgi:2-keto-4-pentenoate hydratase/2-oxohepta-3-ene-1,7-dioic acid hydratase in catechol pathway